MHPKFSLINSINLVASALKIQCTTVESHLKATDIYVPAIVVALATEQVTIEEALQYLGLRTTVREIISSDQDSASEDVDMEEIEAYLELPSMSEVSDSDTELIRVISPTSATAEEPDSDIEFIHIVPSELSAAEEDSDLDIEFVCIVLSQRKFSHDSDGDFEMSVLFEKRGQQRAL
ncbi:hypothetical protein Moror_15957 [Moniliophthora roreri MCA 2997]|uniref:Uncharacterized protein n=1 Tax=Moniliophthora roreri (strain MCA 2997) TaxID=1381753 RepID=V2X0V1_MONRO|nr:hypothetical protein Moror_15957 [Moniliophthora roreri MCA 2997]